MEWLSALRKTYTISQIYSPSRDWERPSVNMVGGRVQLMTEEREGMEELSDGCLEKSDIIETLLSEGLLTMGAGGRGDREKMHRIMHAYNGNIPTPINTAPTPAFPQSLAEEGQGGGSAGDSSMGGGEQQVQRQGNLYQLIPIPREDESAMTIPMFLLPNGNSTEKAQPEAQPEEAAETRSCQGQQHPAITAMAASKIERKKRRRETGHQGGATGNANRTPLQGQSRTTAAAAAAPVAVAPAAAASAAALATASSLSAGPPRVRDRNSELHGAGTVLPSSRFSLAGASEVAKRIISDGRGKEAKFDPAGAEVEEVDKDEAPSTDQPASSSAHTSAGPAPQSAPTDRAGCREKEANRGGKGARGARNRKRGQRHREGARRDGRGGKSP
uniref:Uncharacterized protein n=1 Tax=Chromera velia CCMP2878 TaxID=1169474 RepID=A0A0G4HVG5_9ALVE|eukprot:Cvel_8856.t1-p1 / transcript=Cvel_8856.t1 / gene=Cvel_8856 / organism=Chromera_velia_CCMP2878 / gene_product=hypothetical protein / transcript_product=hypothetical protein / location=Cvel_scaffold498:6405-7562(+) / protein_length=386 / sequence_SO=supercontig / SO=protein_coding / is_pseudo=false